MRLLNDLIEINDTPEALGKRKSQKIQSLKLKVVDSYNFSFFSLYSLYAHEFINAMCLL